MRLSSSTWLPWLFFGPLLVMMVAYIAHDLTGAAWLARVAQGALAFVVLVGVAGFLSARRRAPAAEDDDEGSSRA